MSDTLSEFEMEDSRYEFSPPLSVSYLEEAGKHYYDITYLDVIGAGDSAEEAWKDLLQQLRNLLIWREKRTREKLSMKQRHLYDKVAKVARKC